MIQTVSKFLVSTLISFSTRADSKKILMDYFDELHGKTTTTFLLAKRKFKKNKKREKNFKQVCQIEKRHLISLFPCEQ